jgi:hypothetical protein
VAEPPSRRSGWGDFKSLLPAAAAESQGSFSGKAPTCSSPYIHMGGGWESTWDLSDRCRRASNAMDKKI